MCKMCARGNKELAPETVPMDIPQKNVETSQEEERAPKIEKVIMDLQMPKRVINQLRKLKLEHNISTDPSHPIIQEQVEYQPDLLAVSTQYTKLGYEMVRSLYREFKKTHAYIVFTKTTQPMHVVLALLVLCCWFGARSSSDVSSLRVWKALYVSGVGVHLGAQIWMSLISGIVLYFSIPRHEFGRVQTVLFPVYFAFNAIISFVSLLSYLKIQCISSFHSTSWVQIMLLLVTFLIETTIRLYFVKPMLQMKHLKTQMEESAGGGQEVGKLVLGELAHCPRYMKILKAFRGYHSTIAMGNMISLGCSIYSLLIVVDSVCV